MNTLLQCLILLLIFGALTNLEASKQTSPTSDEVLIEGGGGGGGGSIVFDATKDEMIELHRNLRFEPPEIDFGLWSVGVPRSHKVMLVNENANRSVYLSSVSGRTPIFYSSFFETRVIPPLSNTTFDVVFLPRKSVLATDLLTVHTSFGQAELLVRGEGLECPYRLKPIVGIKAPLNALLNPEIYMYNPHERPLQIIEIYSSGGEFKLELPSGLSSAPQALWEIPPRTTKPIIRIKFHGNSAGNHTTFIRIKIAAQKVHPNIEDVLVVPVEFEILPNPGIYTENPVLDFGRLTNVKSKDRIQLKIKLQNSEKTVDNTVEAVNLLSDENLMPGLSFEYNDGGKLTLDAEIFNKSTTIDELLTLQSKTESNTSLSNIFTIRVRAEIFKGNLYFNRNASIFITGAASSPSVGPRTLTVRNDFEQPLTIFNTSIIALNFKAINVTFVEEFKKKMVLQPGESKDLFHLQLIDENSNLQTSIQILTNITDFEIPLVTCTGRLHVSTHHEAILHPKNIYNTELNMGAVPLEEMSSSGFIALHNPHPINIRIVNWNFKSPHGVYFHTTSMGCLRPNALLDLKSNKSITIEGSNFRFCSALNEGDIIVFQVAIQSHVTELQTATLEIWTPYETITTTVLFHTWVGKLEVDQEELYFKNCFPGKKCSSDLSIRSTFQHPIHITAINFTDNSIHFPSDDTKKVVFALTPNAVTRLGRIYFEPALHCQKRCYLPHDEKFNSLAFPKSSSIENNNFHFDETELRRRTDLYRQMKRHFRTISFMLNSRELRQVQLQAIIDIKWPKLVNDGAQKMPTIEAGKFQEHIINLKNPTDVPILVDFFLANPIYAQKTKLSLPVEVVDMSSSCYLTDKNVFSLTKEINDPILVLPQDSLDIPIRFDAPLKSTDSYCTLLHIRNNLTLYEAVWISAKSVQSQFRFGNRKPGSTNPLNFDVQEKYLAACQQQLPVYVKRTFTARNTGEVPIHIDLFMIDDEDCEGYGFRIMDCEPFELKANESRKIEIVFRPDFTQLRVTRTLRILTNLSYDINYILYAQLPSAELLNQCTEAMERPDWEHHIRIASVLLLLTSFILVIAAANADADNIRRSQSALYIAREKGAIQPTFNLRNIAIKSTTPTTTLTTTTTNKSNKTSNNNQTNQRQQLNKTNNSYSNNSSHQHQHKNGRRRYVANPRKLTSSTESIRVQTSNDTNEFKPHFDDKFNLDFDEITMNDWQDTYDCSPSSSSNSGSFKSSPLPTKLLEERDLDAGQKKQKTPPMQTGKLKNTTRKGKQITTATSSTNRNPIIELMDKDIVENDNNKIVESTKTETTLLKRITESIAAAVTVSNKNKTTVDKFKEIKSKDTNNEQKQKLSHVEEIKPEAGIVVSNNVTKSRAVDSEDVLKTTLKEEQQAPQMPQKCKTPINDLSSTKNIKQKLQDSNTNNIKKPQISNVKVSNYIGPIRNMEKIQMAQADLASQTASNSKIFQMTQTQQTPASPNVVSPNTFTNAPPKIQTCASPNTLTGAPIKTNNLPQTTLNNLTLTTSNNLPQTTPETLTTEIKPTNISSQKPKVNEYFESKTHTEYNGQALLRALQQPAANNLNNMYSLQTETITTSLKYGKTPGRERNLKEQGKVENANTTNNINSNNDLKSKHKVVKSLNFDEDKNYNNAANSISKTAPPLRTAQKTLIAPIHVDSEKGAVYIDLKKAKNLNTNLVGTEIDNKNSNALPPEKSNAMVQSISYIVKETSAQLQQQKSTELGPIGTKKSPSSTPNWESVVGNASSNVRIPVQPKVLDLNSSFFTNISPSAPVTAKSIVGVGGSSGGGIVTGTNGSGIVTGINNGNNFDFNAAQSILGNVTTASLYELKKAQVELQRQLEANEFLLNLRRKQIEEQQFQQQQQQELLKSITQWPRASNVTQVESSTWGPIGGAYGGGNNAAVMGYKQNENKKSLTPSLEDYAAWPSTSSASVRPPPGLGGTKITAPPGLGPQQQRIQRNNINTNVDNNSNIANNINNNNNPNATTINSQNDVRAFDPFSSLGSIWSDNWKRPNNQNN